MALMLVDGFVKLVLTLGPHPNAPLELYMNRGDRLDDRQWHTVEVIRSLKVGTTFKLRFFLVVNISNPSDIIDHATTFLYFLRTLRLEIVSDFLRAHSLVDILSFSRERGEKINKLWSITRTEKFCLALGLFCCFSRCQWYSIMLRENIIHQKLHENATDWPDPVLSIDLMPASVLPIRLCVYLIIMLMCGSLPHDAVHEADLWIRLQTRKLLRRLSYFLHDV